MDLSFDFDSGYLFFSIIWGIFGMAYFTYGKKQNQIPLIILGLLLMIFPYFVTDLFTMNILGCVLLLLPLLIKRIGY